MGLADLLPGRAGAGPAAVTGSRVDGQQLPRLVPYDEGLLHVAGRRDRRVERAVARAAERLRSAPYSTPRTRRRTTTGTATTERRPSAATAVSYSWLICRETG